MELYSSDGPRRMFYAADGTPYTPGNFLASGGIVRQKPDLAAADDIATTVHGFAAFYGTSAAAPHAAAIAALLKSYNPALTPAQMRTALLAGCLDIEAPGVDRDSGAGLLMADLALAAAPPPPPSPLIVAGALTLDTGADAPPAGAVIGSFTLQNAGGAPTTGLTATLLNEAGVALPGAPQSYGVLATGGGSATRTFTFTASGTGGAHTKARLHLTDGATDLGIVEFPFTLTSAAPATTTTFTSAGPITIPDLGGGAPWPSALTDTMPEGGTVWRRSTCGQCGGAWRSTINRCREPAAGSRD